MIQDDPRMAELWPTGKFGRAELVRRGPLPPLPERPPERRPIRPWTPEEQAQHRADLLAALEGWQDKTEAADRRREYSREYGRQHGKQIRSARRLRLVPPPAQDQRPGTAAA
ncbi:hypothetical protein ACFWBB_30940 [Streptomyces sp. NPDC060000]|uniref:hypothetical protein n=1 Tax=Streptomyces sp. NPDC060000 TaxID=3347031 RepID=UPI0036B0084A